MTYRESKFASPAISEQAQSTFPPSPRLFVIAGGMLGFGFGGLFDAIVLHLLLQWHHMISNQVSMNTLAGLQVNILGDGVFSAAMGLIIAIALGVLWRGMQKAPILPLTTPAFIGWILVGWGSFHLFDSIVFHALFKLHHIRQVPNFLGYDIAFLLVGLVLIGLGYWMTRRQINV